MALHIGKKIKEILYNKKLKISDFAISINRSRNVVYNIFERKAIDTELLKKISEVLDYNFFSYYANDLGIPTAEETGAKYNKTKTKIEDELTQCRKDLEDLKEKYELLLKINNLLEEKKTYTSTTKKKKSS